MYLHLGMETVVSASDIVGIFDIENTSIGKGTKEFLATAEKNGRVVNVSYELPKSFIVCAGKKRSDEVVYISQISAATLKKRLSFIDSLSV